MNIDYSKTDAIGGGAMCSMSDGDDCKPTREELPRCQCEYQSDPQEWSKCGRPAVAKWTMQDGTVMFCCEDCDDELSLAIEPLTRAVPCRDCDGAGQIVGKGDCGSCGGRGCVPV